MKPLILATILAFTLTHASAQSLTCRPLPNGTTVCAPTPTGGAGIGPALAVIVVLYFVIQYLKKDEQQSDTDK